MRVRRIVFLVIDASRVDDVVRATSPLVAEGYRVTVVGLGTAPSSVMSGVRVLWVDVPWSSTEAGKVRRARRRARVLPLGFRSTRQAEAARKRLAARRLALPWEGDTAVGRVAVAGATGAVELWAHVGRGNRALSHALWAVVDVVLHGWIREMETSWRLEDYDAALGRALDRLDPDTIHVTGGEGIVPAVRAAARYSRAGRQVRVLYEAPADRDSMSSARGRRRSSPWGRKERRWLRHVEQLPVSALADASVRADVLPPARPSPSSTPARATRVGIGPANMAGQAWQWAKALEKNASGVTTEVIMVDRNSRLIFPADELVPVSTYAGDPAWADRMRERVLETWTHVLLEAGRPVLGLRHGRTFLGDAHVLERAGLTVGVVLHGSEVRDPRSHAARHPWSPFREAGAPWVVNLQAAVDTLRPDLEAFDGPRFVATPDLLFDVPDAIWLPVVVDSAVWRWAPRRTGSRVPVVAHVPSRASVKGSDFVDTAVRELVAAGQIEYLRLEGVVPAQMPETLAGADIVLDQFALGSYGVLACEAMASGAPVIGHVTPEVRAMVHDQTGVEVPIIEADPSSLTDVLRGLLEEPAKLERAARAGREFVERVHNGEWSAKVLVRSMDIS